MTTAMSWYPERGNRVSNSNRIWHNSLCIEFNNNGGLTPAELRVIHLLLKGYTSGQIATLCFRSIKTISVQKGNAFRRLGVRNDATLLPTLLLRGVVTLYTDLNRVDLPAVGHRISPK
ncbi:helix-turn-helix transcriptional regulator [Salmonella enterica]|nr:helix-turn-helix transcriptional regulator [Salmonella enterica]